MNGVKQQGCGEESERGAAPKAVWRGGRRGVLVLASCSRRVADEWWMRGVALVVGAVMSCLVACSADERDGDRLAAGGAAGSTTVAAADGAPGDVVIPPGRLSL